MAKRAKPDKKLKGHVAEHIQVTGHLQVTEPEAAISTSASDILVSIYREDGTVDELFYSVKELSDMSVQSIAQSINAHLGFREEPTDHEKLIEAIEQVTETHWKKFKVSIWPPGLEIEWAPKKTIKLLKVKDISCK